MTQLDVDLVVHAYFINADETKNENRNIQNFIFSICKSNTNF